jgi:hypothetical protein
MADALGGAASLLTALLDQDTGARGLGRTTVLPL